MSNTLSRHLCNHDTVDYVLPKVKLKRKEKIQWKCPGVLCPVWLCLLPWNLSGVSKICVCFSCLLGEESSAARARFRVLQKHLPLLSQKGFKTFATTSSSPVQKKIPKVPNKHDRVLIFNLIQNARIDYRKGWQSTCDFWYIRLLDTWKNQYFLAEFLKKVQKKKRYEKFCSFILSSFWEHGGRPSS